MIKRLVSGVNAWQGEPVTRRADFNARHQAGVLNGLWLESGLDQTTAAANGGMSQSTFWRLIKGHQPLREDQYPSMAREHLQPRDRHPSSARGECHRGGSGPETWRIAREWHAERPLTRRETRA